MRRSIGKIRVWMEHKRGFKFVSCLLRKLKLVELLHLLCEYTDRQQIRKDRFLFQQFFENHEKEFLRLEELLSDELSVKTLHAVLAYRMNGKKRELFKIRRDSQYFQKDIIKLSDKCVFVEGGGYTGDTIEAFYKYTNGRYKKIYTWEPDKDNIVIMKKNICNYHNVEVVPMGMWNERRTLHFKMQGSGSKVNTNGEVAVECATIDDVHKDDKISFIKMDIEGAEWEALHGAQNTIKKQKPILAVCVYHKFEDLYRIAFWLKEQVHGYKFYLRHHSDVSSETVLYAIYK